jgi:glycine hydroxymethyltransferase
MFGASEYLFPHPVAELAEIAHAVGALVCYDGAHPLGLIAGGAFHDPLADGADVLLGSTNKTFFGPHRGIILVRDDESVFESIQAAVTSPPVLQSTHHTNTAVALVAALAEMTEFGVDYAAAVVSNARALASALDRRGVPVLAMDAGATASHQVIIRADGYCAPDSVRLQRRLAEAGILADCVVRFGTQQLTRLGMGPSEMDVVGDLIARVYDDELGRELTTVRSEVRDLAQSFRSVQYTFERTEDAFRYVPFTPP